MHRNTLIGLAGVLGIWLTAGLALPFVNVLDMFSPQQLMVARGYIMALIAFILMRGVVIKGVDKYTYLIALTVPFATLGLFQGIRHWGAGPTIIIITATPLLNFFFGLFLGRRVSFASIIGLVLVLGGVVIARWGGHFEWKGFAWAVFGTVANSLLLEWLARAKAKPYQKCFWGGICMGTLGLILSSNTSWDQMMEPKLMLLVVGFVFVGGFLYWLANIVAFERLPTNEASVLAQGETPAVILGSYFLLGEKLTLVQWVGVAVALIGVILLMRWLSKKPVTPQKAEGLLEQTFALD